MGKPLCGAMKTDGSGTCTLGAGWQTDHPGHGRCKWHGGASPSGSKAGKRAAAESAVATYGLPIEVDPADALLDEVARSFGHVHYLLAKVRETDPDRLVWGRTEKVFRDSGEFPGVDTTEAAKPNAWLELYMRERDYLRRVCVDVLKAGVDERRLRMAEEDQRQTAEFMRRVVKAFGIPDTPETWETIREQWTVIEGGAA